MGQTRSLPGIALLAALSMVTVGSAGAAPIFSDATIICEKAPSSAAVDAANPQITPDDPDGNDDCGELCQKWVSKCKGIVAGLHACWKKAAAQIASLRNATCNTDPATADACRETVKAEKESVKLVVDPNADDGREYCEGTGLGLCIAQCS
jgi:hypothetical protein